MAEETIDPSLLEQTKNQIRKLVAEIAELAESDIQPPEFYAEFLNRSVAAVAASGGALWLLDGRGGLKLQHQLEFRATGLMDGRVRTQPHDALLGVMMQANAPQIIPPGAGVEGVPNAGNPTAFALILAPLIVDKQPVGLVEILMDPTRRAATQKSTLRFVSDLCDLAGTYLKNRQTRQVMSQQRLWNQLEGFTHTIHASLDMKESAYSVVNDGKRLVGCDRLSVCLKVGGRTMIEAVSGQEVVEQRANLIREMTKLCKMVLRSGEDLVYTGNTEGFAPDLRDVLEGYVDESGSKAVVVTLLHKPESDASKEKVPFGCVVAEQIGDEMAPTDMHARTEVVARHASTALWNASEYDKTMLPLLKLVGSPWRFFRGRTLAKILAVAAAILDRHRRADVRAVGADHRGPRPAPAGEPPQHLRPAPGGRHRGPRGARPDGSRRATCSRSWRAATWRSSSRRSSPSAPRPRPSAAPSTSRSSPPSATAATTRCTSSRGSGTRP